MNTSQIDNMTEAEIIAEAERRGYTIHEAKSGLRVGGSKQKSGTDEWMNTANVRLWQLQTGQS